jgi:hypothetical protein
VRQIATDRGLLTPLLWLRRRNRARRIGAPHRRTRPASFCTSDPWARGRPQRAINRCASRPTYPAFGGTAVRSIRWMFRDTLRARAPRADRCRFSPRADAGSARYARALLRLPTRLQRCQRMHPGPPGARSLNAARLDFATVRRPLSDGAARQRGRTRFSNASPVVARFGTGSTSGRPKDSNPVVSANHVSADTCGPTSVRTSNPYGRATSSEGPAK